MTGGMSGEENSGQCKEVLVGSLLDRVGGLL